MSLLSSNELERDVLNYYYIEKRSTERFALQRAMTCTYDYLASSKDGCCPLGASAR
jgi:hypothetical protein